MQESTPPFSYVEELLLSKVESITYEADATSYELFLTGDANFRKDIAKTKTYKGNRTQLPPFHAKNLVVYLRDVLGASIYEGLEADDLMAISQTEDTIICSRDKDLRQVPGWFYTWELGSQPSYGPRKHSKLGELWYSKDMKLYGNGYLWFCCQLLTGDSTDNIPGCKSIGPAKAHEALSTCTDFEEAMDKVKWLYERAGHDEDYLIEQGQLLWMIRRFVDDKPEMWHPLLYY